MHQAEVINKNLFTLCFANNGGYFSTGGINSLYHNPNETIAYVPTLPGENYYTLKFKSLSISGNIKSETNNLIMQISKTGFIDSGTTLSYFPGTMYNEFINNFKNFCTNKNKCLNKSTFDSQDSSYCFEIPDNLSYSEFLESYPIITFNFDESNYNYKWLPKNYFYLSSDNNGKTAYCIGVICIFLLILQSWRKFFTWRNLDA